MYLNFKTNKINHRLLFSLLAYAPHTCAPERVRHVVPDLDGSRYANDAAELSKPSGLSQRINCQLSGTRNT